ncbi:MAG: DNA cytosine methyltransferase, partial [Clostridia bacterium]|nr:DNA cytosine methyltransferase [Clostridia bacterium]
SEGVSGYSAESFRAWQRAANGTEDSTGASGFGLDGYNGSVSDKAATLGVNCGMSTGRNGVVLNDQGGNRMDVTEEVTCTLRAEAHHPPCVLESAGFCTEHSANSRSIGYEEERSPTLRAGVVPAAIAIENHPADGRVKLEEGDAIQTLTSRMGTGGGNVPLVMNWDGGQIAPTLTKQNAGGNQRMPDKDNFNCVLQPFGICSKDSNAMKSANPHSGIYEADTSRTLDGNGGNPSCNQGGIAVVCIDQGGGKSACNITEEKAPTLACTHGGEPAVCVKSETIVIEGNGTRPSHQGDGFKESDVMYTLNTVDRHAVYAMTTGSFTHVEKEKSPTLMARDYKDPNAVCYGVGRDTFNQGKNAKFVPSFSEEVQPTMVAKGPGAVVSPYGFDPSCARDLGKYFLEDCGNTLVNGTCPGHHNGVMEPDYTVRRLTPTECARLQGFPDWWCSGLDDKYPAIQDIRFWKDVWETYANVIGGCKPKTDKQVRRWLEYPHSDSAEYKLWGNGVALPCVFFVLSGIVYYTQIDTE